MFTGCSTFGRHSAYAEEEESGINKTYALILVVILATSSLLMVKPSDAQTIPKPSVPEFTVSLTDRSYTSPPTVYSKTDPYTNKTTTLTESGSFVANFTLDVKIKNQQYPSNIGGNSSNLYYNVRTKGFYGEDWSERYSYTYADYESPAKLPAQSNSSEYTVLSFPTHYRVGDLVDVQVEAILGYSYTYYPKEQVHIFPVPVTVFIYEKSGWSPTQTFTMPDLGYGSHSPTFPVMSVDLLLRIVAVVAVAALVAVVLLLFYVRRLKRRLAKK